MGEWRGPELGNNGDVYEDYESEAWRAAYRAEAAARRAEEAAAAGNGGGLQPNQLRHQDDREGLEWTKDDDNVWGDDDDAVDGTLK